MTPAEIQKSEMLNDIRKAIKKIEKFNEELKAAAEVVGEEFVFAATSTISEDDAIRNVSLTNSGILRYEQFDSMGDNNWHEYTESLIREYDDVDIDSKDDYRFYFDTDDLNLTLSTWRANLRRALRVQKAMNNAAAHNKELTDEQIEDIANN